MNDKTYPRIKNYDWEKSLSDNIEELFIEVDDYVPEEDPERSVSNQEIINALEECINKLETFKGKKQIEQIVKTLILVCKILSVELNKATPEGLRKPKYIS